MSDDRMYRIKADGKFLDMFEHVMGGKGDLHV